MSSAVTILGTSILALLLAGYLAQKYLPPPKPKLVGIDLGTTYSCIGVYHAVTGNVNAIPDKEGHKCIPSIVAFSEDRVVVGYHAEAQQEHNPGNTVYDAKRFIGKQFTKDELAAESRRYPFKMVIDEYGMVRYEIVHRQNVTRYTPEYIGSQILQTLKQTAEQNLSVSVTKAVISVPAEFNELQRNYTRKAAQLAGLDVLRVINEPTAAAMAYGLHKKEKTRNVLVVDLGGGTLDVSLLNIQGGMFFTQAMAGNNHLGGQDFNERLMNYILNLIEQKFKQTLNDPEDLQTLRHLVEEAKINLTNTQQTLFQLRIPSFKYGAEIAQIITRQQFEDINIDLFKKVLVPVQKVLEAIELHPQEVDEIVLVGGSTRIPKVRQLIKDYFGKSPNVAIDPELAVVSGVSIQAGIMGGMWPLNVSAIELPIKARKIHVQ